jgi:hypothetical protein
MRDFFFNVNEPLNYLHRKLDLLDEHNLRF